MAEADAPGVDSLRDAALAEIAACPDLAALDQVRVRYLGKSGLLTVQLKQLGALPKEERPAAGALINRRQGGGAGGYRRPPYRPGAARH